MIRESEEPGPEPPNEPKIAGPSVLRGYFGWNVAIAFWKTSECDAKVHAVKTAVDQFMTHNVII